MRIHSFQHVPFEDIGSMAQDFMARGFSHSTTHWYQGDLAPAPEDYDLLIVMGGPMGVYDEAIYPWLAREKQALKEAIAQSKKLLGICLGAQLIAQVLGAEVRSNGRREIGWFPLEVPASAAANPVAQLLAGSPLVFHWHGDRFELPKGAQLLATSQACKHQAFCVGEHIWGFQFHLETTPASAQALIEHCGTDIDGSEFTQTSAEIMANAPAFTRINATMTQVLAQILAT